MEFTWSMFGAIRRAKILTKIISILIIQTFIFSNIAFAVTQDIAPSAKPQESITNPEKIVIPREFGLVKSRFTGNDGRLIVHIQDAHCNYEAQANIVKILENLVKNYNLSLVSVEGADGDIDTSWFKAFPDDEIRKEVATYFMKKGEITGPEFLSITSNYSIELFGAETRSYYIQNLNAFTSSYPLKEETEKYYTQIKNVLNRLKGSIYSEELKMMDLQLQQYESKKIQFNDYIRFLQDMAERQKISLREYENFFKLVNTLIYEKKIDFTLTDKERSALIDELSKRISKDALTELVTQSIMFKTGKIASVEYYHYLRDLSVKNSIDMSKDYPNLYNYIIYNSVYSKIENEKLFSDIKKVETAIKEKLFKNDDQRTLSKLSHHADVLLGLINIKLLNGDFDYYEKNKEEFSYGVFNDFIKKKTAQYGFAFEVDPPSEAVAASIPKLEDFYTIAIKRDKALVDNTLTAMKKDKQQIAVLVTGGFHSEGMAKLLEKQGISYLVVCPTITKDTPTPYIQILTNQRTPLEDILVNVPTDAKQGGGMVAPYLISAAKQIGAKGGKSLENLASQVSAVGGRDLTDRVKDFNTDWTKTYISWWIARAEKFAGRKSLPRDREILEQAFKLAVDTAIAKKRIPAQYKAVIYALADKAFEEIYKTRETAFAQQAQGAIAVKPGEQDMAAGLVQEADLNKPANELQDMMYLMMPLSEIMSFKNDHRLNVRDAAAIAEKRVVAARNLAIGAKPSIHKGQDIRGEVAKELPYDVINDVAIGFLRLVREKTGKKNPRIVVGNDVRTSSPTIKTIVMDALARNGAHVIYIGGTNKAGEPTYSTTPMLSWAFHRYAGAKEPIDATIQITASHLREIFNGLKFMIAGEDITKQDLTNIIGYARDKQFLPPTGKGKMEDTPLLEAYKESLKKDLEPIAEFLQGKRIIIDAGNGTGGFYVDVLRELGADAVPVVVGGVSLCDPNPLFPIHEPNPTLAENRKFIVKAIREDKKAELGITFDSDSDRVVFIDKNGNLVDGQKLLQILGAMTVATRKADPLRPTPVIVANNKTSMATIEGVEALGARFAMSDTGYVATRAMALEIESHGAQTGEAVLLAGEESGHIMFRDNYFIDDGMYTANQVLKAVFSYMKKPLHEILAGMEDYVMYETRAEMTGQNKDEDKKTVPATIAESAQSGETDVVTWQDKMAGTRVYFKSGGKHVGWVLFRGSLTDPVMAIMVEGKTLDNAIDCCRQAFALVRGHQGAIDPRRLVAFKQGLEIAKNIVGDGETDFHAINEHMRAIFSPMKERGLTPKEVDTLPDPLLVAYRMNAVRQGLVNSKVSDKKLRIYYESLINQYIAFMQREMIGIDWDSKALMREKPDLGKARGMMASEIEEAESFVKPIKERERREDALKALTVLYGKRFVEAQIKAAGGNKDAAIKRILLGGKTGKIGNTNSLRLRVNNVVGKDIVSGQRIAQSKDKAARAKEEAREEALALHFLTTVCIKLGSELGRELRQVGADEFRKIFNKNFGVLVISLGGGYGARFSPTQLAHKAYGTPYFNGTTNAMMTLGYGAAVGESSEYPYTRTVSQSDFSIFTFLKDSVKRKLRLGQIKFGEKIRPPSKPMNVGVTPEEDYFGMDEAYSYPRGTLHVGQNVYGYGGGFIGQIDMMVEMQLEGQLPDVPYLMRFDQEHCTINDRTTADVALVTWMQTVADDNTITVGLKSSTEILDKGSPKDISLMHREVLRHLVDWRNTTAEEVKKKCLALLVNPQTGKPNPGTEYLVQRIMAGELDNVKEEGDEKSMQLLAEIHGDISPDQRNTIPINSNITVVHRRIATRLPELGNRSFIDDEVLKASPYLKDQRDDKKGLPEWTPNDPIVIMFDHYADNRPGERPPVGCVVVPSGPDHIKSAWKQSEFNRLWQSEMLEILKRNGIKTSKLTCFTVHPGIGPAKFDIAEIERRLFGKGGVFVSPSGEINTDVELIGKVHVDLTSNIGNGAVLNNSEVYGYVRVGSNCRLTDTVIEGRDPNKPHVVRDGVKLTDCKLRDNEAVAWNLTAEIRIPADMKTEENEEREVLDYIYGRSSGEPLVSYEVMEVLAGDVMSDLESFLLQEKKDGKAILEDIQRLRKNALSLKEGEVDDSIDVTRGNDVQYVVRQIIANVGLYGELWSADPAVVGQAYTYPLNPGQLKSLSYREGELTAKDVNQGLVHEIISLFGKKLFELKKKQNMRFVDNIIVVGLKAKNRFTRIGNGTFVDGLTTDGRFYQGDGWGTDGVNVRNKDSVVVLGDHLMVLDKDKRVTSYEPPKRGNINSLTLMKDCTFGTAGKSVRAFIGAGAGQWMDGYRGRVIEGVTFEGPIIIIPEGTDIPKGNNGRPLSGIGERETKLKEELAALSLKDANEKMWDVLKGDTDPKNRQNLGKFTSLATALCLLVMDGQKDRATKLLRTLQRETEMRYEKSGDKTRRAKEATAYYKGLVNKLCIISQVIDSDRVYNKWLLAAGLKWMYEKKDGMNPLNPPKSTPKPNYQALKEEVRGKIDGFRELRDVLRDPELKKLGIEPQVMVVQRNLLPGTKDRSMVYRDSMMSLADIDDPEELGKAVQRYCVVKDPRTLIHIIRGYKAYMKGDAAEMASARATLKTEMHNARDVSNEALAALYFAVLGPGNDIGIRTDKAFKFACFRGGRGAQAFLDAMREQLGDMGIKGDKLEMTMLPGATDDGRSWLLCSLIFEAPGMPDIGKCLLDLAQDKKLKAIMGTRFADIDLIRQFNDTYDGKGKLESAITMRRYGTDNKKTNVTDALNHFVSLFNAELDRKRRDAAAMPDQLAKEIIIHTLAELREGTLENKTINEPTKLWEEFVTNIRKYLTENKQYKKEVRGEANALELILGEKGCLLSGLEMNPEQRIQRLEEELNEILESIIKRDPQVIREFLYAEFCANILMPGFGIPLRSMALVGAHIYFDKEISEGRTGLTMEIQGRPTEMITDAKKKKEIEEKVAEMRAQGLQNSDIAWYVTIKVMEAFLNTQGNVKPATLRRYHLSGLATTLDNKGRPTGMPQVLGSEDAYNEVPKIGPHYSVFVRPRPVLDVGEKEQLRAAIAARDVPTIIGILKSKIPVVANQEAIEAIKNADLLLMFPTTLISNIDSALEVPGIGEAVRDRKTANKIYIHNALLENDPPHTTAATMMEDLYRFLSRQQRYQTEGEGEELNWEKVADYFTYVMLREPCLYEAYEESYIPSDRETIRKNTEGRVTTVPLDTENPVMSAKGKFLGRPLIRGVLQLHQLRNLGFRVSDRGDLENFEGIDAAEIRESESFAAGKHPPIKPDEAKKPGEQDMSATAAQPGEAGEVAATILSARTASSAVNAARGIFSGNAVPSTSAFCATFNILLEAMKQNKGLAPLLEVFARVAINETQRMHASVAPRARDLNLIAVQALNIVSWTTRGIEGAENIRLTDSNGAMVMSTKGKSFIDKNTIPVGVAQAEGAAGLFHRGAEGVGNAQGPFNKMGVNIAMAAIYDGDKFDAERNNFWLYLMEHGFMPVPEAIQEMTTNGSISTIHETAFSLNTLPGSIQYVSTGPGHYQGTKLDVKQVTRGRAIQHNKFYNEKGELVAVISQVVEAGELAVALPFAVDSIEAIGEEPLEFNRFNDFSVEVPNPEEWMQRNFPNMGINFSEVGRAENATKVVTKAAAVVPYYAVNVNGEARLVKNIASAPEVTWVNNAEMRKAMEAAFKVKTLTDLYKGLTPKGIETLTRIVRNAVTAPSWKAEAKSVKAAKISDVEAAKVREIQMAGLSKSIILNTTENNVVYRDWAGRQINKLLGRADDNSIAEFWNNSVKATYNGKLTSVPGTAVAIGETVLPEVTLKQLLAKFPEMLGGHAEKPTFNKFLCTRFAPKVYMGFNAKIEEAGAKERFTKALQADRAFMAELAQNFKEGMTESEFNTVFLPEYEKWVAAQSDRNWTASSTEIGLPNIAGIMRPGYDINGLLERVRRAREEIVSYLNVIELKPGQVILCPVGFPHGIFGLSLQTHPPSWHPGAKNEAWVIMSLGKNSAGQDEILMIEPQQMSDQTISIADFNTPLQYKKGVVGMRKDFRKGLDAFTAVEPATEAEAITLVVEKSLLAKATTQADFDITDKAEDISSRYDVTQEKNNAKVISLIEGTYRNRQDTMDIWPRELFAVHHIVMGLDRTRPSTIEMMPEEDNYHELLVTEGTVTITTPGQPPITLGKGSPAFIPATIKTPYTITTQGPAEILKFVSPLETGPAVAPMTEPRPISTTQPAPVATGGMTAGEGKAGVGAAAVRKPGETDMAATRRAPKAEGLSAADLRAMIAEEQAETARELAVCSAAAEDKDAILMLLVDTDIYGGNARNAITGLAGEVNGKTKPGSVVVIAGKGAELVEKRDMALRSAQKHGLVVRKVVTQLSAANALGGIDGELSKSGYVLKVNVDKDLSKNYMQVIRLFKLCFQIGYYNVEAGQGIDSIKQTLSMIMGRAVGDSELSAWLANKIIEILPKLEKIDTEATAVEAYKAVRKALTSL